MKSLLTLSVFFVAAISGAQSTTTSKTTKITAPTATQAPQASAAAGTATGTAAPTTTPTQTCNKLVEAAKSNNYESMAGLVMTHEHGKGHGKKDGMKKPSKAKFDKMHAEYMSEIKDVTCGNEMVAGDRAVVTAESTTQKRLIPFVQADGQWKFDMKTYRSFYAGDAKDAKKSM